MARNTGRMALYEAISQSRKKQAGKESQRQKIVRLRSGFLRKRKEGRIAAKKTLLRRKPNPSAAGVQGIRTKIGLSYVTAVLIALGLIVIVLAGIKLGQLAGRRGPEQGRSGIVGNTDRGGEQDLRTGPYENRRSTEPNEDLQQGNEAFVSSTGQNVIVIASYGREPDLVPVQTHFAEQGIATEVRSLGDNYLLVTRQRYDNPNRRDSNGYAALQKVKEIGAGYKAPSGYERFGSRPFQDAYGRKVWWE